MDEGTEREHDSISGDVEPAGTGEWLTLKEAGARLGIDPKAVYRRYKRSKLQGKKAPQASHLLVWLPREPGHLEAGTGEQDQEGEPGHLAVPETGERFLRLMEQATASMARLEEVARENGELRERAVQLEHAVAAYRREYDWLKTALERARKPWWKFWA